MQSLSTLNDRPTWWPAARRWAAGHRLWLGAGTFGALALALGWNRLAAAGALSILLGTLPCAVMMGLCMKGMNGNKSCSQDKPVADAAVPPNPASPVAGTISASLPDSQPPVLENNHA